MSKTTKIVLWVVVAVIVIGGIWWWMSQGSNSNNGSDTQAPASQLNGVAPTSTGPAATGTSMVAPASDNSNASLSADLSNIDGQMNGLSSDAVNVNAGLNDKPISQ